MLGWSLNDIEYVATRYRSITFCLATHRTAKETIRHLMGFVVKISLIERYDYRFIYVSLLTHVCTLVREYF